VPRGASPDIFSSDRAIGLVSSKGRTSDCLRAAADANKEGSGLLWPEPTKTLRLRKRWPGADRAQESQELAFNPTIDETIYA